MYLYIIEFDVIFDNQVCFVDRINRKDDIQGFWDTSLENNLKCLSKTLTGVEGIFLGLIRVDLNNHKKN